MRIIFKDFCDEYFEGNYIDMINWLNLNLVGFRVDFIANDYKLIKDDTWKTKSYNPIPGFHITKFGIIRVDMLNGQYGKALGLVFLEDIPLPNENKSKIRWYKKGKLYDDK